MGRHKKIRGLYLSHRIFQSYPYKFVGALIYGQRGIGKTSLALNVAWEVFRMAGHDEKESWDLALNSCKFTMDDVLETIEGHARAKDKARILIWDDVGVHASNMEWWDNRDLLKRLKAVTDMIRTGVCGLILTTPSQGGILKFLREYDDYIVDIGYCEESRYRLAKGYIRRTLPSGTLRIYPKFKNKYRVMLPDWVFEKYNESRLDIFLSELDRLKKAGKKPS